MSFGYALCYIIVFIWQISVCPSQIDLIRFYFRFFFLLNTVFEEYYSFKFTSKPEKLNSSINTLFDWNSEEPLTLFSYAQCNFDGRLSMCASTGIRKRCMSWWVQYMYMQWAMSLLRALRICLLFFFCHSISRIKYLSAMSNDVIVKNSFAIQKHTQKKKTHCLLARHPFYRY